MCNVLARTVDLQMSQQISHIIYSILLAYQQEKERMHFVLYSFQLRPNSAPNDTINFSLFSRWPFFCGGGGVCCFHSGDVYFTNLQGMWNFCEFVPDSELPSTQIRRATPTAVHVSSINLFFYKSPSLKKNYHLPKYIAVDELCTHTEKWCWKKFTAKM